MGNADKGRDLVAGLPARGGDAPTFLIERFEFVHRLGAQPSFLFTAQYHPDVIVRRVLVDHYSTPTHLGPL